MPLKRYHKDFDHSYTPGVFPTLELLHHRPDLARRVLTHSRGERNEGVARLWQACAERGLPIQVDDKTIEKLTGRGNDYALGVFGKEQQALDAGAPHVVLVNPSDMGNLGTIMRTLAGFGAGDLALVEPAADHYDPRVVRASMGALFQVRVARFATFDAYLDAFPGHALYPLMTAAAIPLEAARFEEPFALVFGSESAGLPEPFLDIGTPLRIPQTDRVDSLNLAVAVGIALYASLGRGLAGA